MPPLAPLAPPATLAPPAPLTPLPRNQPRNYLYTPVFGGEDGTMFNDVFFQGRDGALYFISFQQATAIDPDCAAAVLTKQRIRISEGQ